MLGVYAERAYQLEQGPRDPRFDANYAATGKDGKPLTFAEAKEVRLLEREQARIPMAMFTVNTKTGEQKIIHHSTDWLNHLQFSPTDPKALMFCHEGPWHRVDRIWSMRLGEEPKARAPAHHEHGNRRPRILRRERQHHLVRPADTARRGLLAAPRPGPMAAIGAGITSSATSGRCTSTISPDGKLFAGDGGDEEMVAHAKDGKWMYLFHPQAIPDVAGISAPERGTPHASGHAQAPNGWSTCSKHDYRLEPNVIFTRDAKWMIFRSNMHGDVHTYMVEVARVR